MYVGGEIILLRTGMHAWKLFITKPIVVCLSVTEYNEKNNSQASAIIAITHTLNKSSRFWTGLAKLLSRLNFRGLLLHGLTRNSTCIILSRQETTQLAKMVLYNTRRYFMSFYTYFIYLHQPGSTGEERTDNPRIWDHVLINYLLFLFTWSLSLSSII